VVRHQGVVVVPAAVFINYRGEDSHSYGVLLHAELSRRFGPELVFLDSVSIPPGADFVEQLLEQVRRSAVVLAVIGTRWLTAVGPGGGRRIDDPADWIRQELAEAFTAGVRVIPVLTDDATMPTEAELPGELAALGRGQYRRLRHRDAAADLARLAGELAALDAGLGVAAAARPSAEGWPVPNQLPAAARYFTGRQKELSRLVQLSAEDDAAPAMVVSAVDGMAGIGKTSLVVLAAHRLTDGGRYTGGTLFVDLHGYSGRPPADPAAALDALLRGLGVPGPQIPPDMEARIGLYRTVTARRRVLVVLDNAREEEQVRPLLPGGDGSLVLITSRRRLSGLDEADHLNLDTLPPSEATRLFRAVTGPDRDPGDQHTVEEIVRLCGYLPLAVRIAAARLRTDRSHTMTGPGMLAQLRAEQHTDRLAALTEGDRSVAAAFGISYRHLPAKQRRAFAALGLHPGQDYEPYATAALLNTSPANAGRLLNALEQVSLLDQPSASRYRFHDLIHAYAATLAQARPDTQRYAALDRLYSHYAHTTSHAATLAYPYDADHLPRPPQAATPAPHLSDLGSAEGWLEAEQSNLLAAATHATSRRPEHTTHQSAALHRHLYLRGHYTDAYALHQNALTAAQETGDPIAQISALNNLGRIHHMHGRYGPATDCFTQALQIATAVGNRHGELTALNRLGDVHFAHGRYDPATECHTRVLRAALATDNRVSELEALSGLGWVHQVQGQYDAAADCLTRSLETARAIGQRPGELAALNALGRIQLAQGRYGPAGDCYTQALETARATRHRAGETTALNGLARVHLIVGRYGSATDCNTRALETARAAGNRAGELDALLGLGHIHYAHGRYGPAADCFRQVLDLAHESGNRNYQREAHLSLGKTHHASGHPDQALAAHQHALTLARDLNQPTDQARAHNGLARTYQALGHRDQARQHWQRALDILTTLNIPIADDVTAAKLRTHLARLGDPTAGRPRS
jgi:tetratricopeptide (TPR) repeat protein